MGGRGGEGIEGERGWEEYLGRRGRGEVIEGGDG